MQVHLVSGVTRRTAVPFELVAEAGPTDSAFLQLASLLGAWPG